LVDELGRIYEIRGRAGIVEYALRSNIEGPPMQRALLLAEAGNLDAAFWHLDRAIADRDPALVHLAVAPQWDALRVDPRFDTRLETMGLDGASTRAQQFLQRS
jgi:hypothetical protein